MINFDDFKKVEMRVGEILSAEKIPETDRLLKLSVSFGLKDASQNLEKEDSEGEVQESVLSPTLDTKVGLRTKQEEDIRQVVSGIAEHFPEPESLVGKLCAFVVNLEPRKIKGLESEAMVLAVSSEGNFSLLEPNEGISPGSKIG